MRLTLQNARCCPYVKYVDGSYVAALSIGIYTFCYYTGGGGDLSSLVEQQQQHWLC